MRPAGRRSLEFSRCVLTFGCLGRRFDRAVDVTPFMVTHINAQLSQVRTLDLRERVEHRIWDAVVCLVEDVGLDDRVANALWEAFFDRDVAGRAPIVGVLAQRIAAEAALSSGQRRTASPEGSVARRRVDVRHSQLARDAVLDYEIEVRDDGGARGVMRASLSPEAWGRLGTLLGLADWHIPSGPLSGDATAEE